MVLVQKLLPEERRAIISKQLIEAGWYTTTPAKFGMRMVGGAILGFVMTLLVWRIVNFPLGLLPVLLAAFTFVGGYSPFFALNRAMEARKAGIQKALPEFLDMVSSTVQAGLALNSALGYAVEAVPGPLGDEIKEALSEIRLGRARGEALRAVGERTNHPALRNALRVMTQAERLGANIAKLLNDLAADARHQRLMLVEEMAAKLPVKMVFPMVLFMIPAIVTVIFGSVAANYFATPK
jgi:tight adherence protein C